MREHGGQWIPKIQKEHGVLTGKGRRVKEQSDGSQIIHEGTWGPRDPENPKGTWGLNGQGRVVRKQSDGAQIIHEGLLVHKIPAI